MGECMDAAELKVPLSVIRWLVAVAEERGDAASSEGGWLNSSTEAEANYRYAIKWLADHSIYREECLNDQLVQARLERFRCE